MSNEQVNWEKWRRAKAPFEDVLGHYQLKMVLKYIKGPSILDVACGDGTLTKQISEIYPDITGIDASKPMIEKAKKRIPDANFIETDFDSYSPESKFDTVIMINILEHVDDANKLMQKAKDWTTENGNIIIQVPNATSLNRRIGTKMGLEESCYTLNETDKSLGHTTVYDLEMLKELAEKSGLEIIDSGGFFLKPFANYQMKQIFETNLWNDEKERQDYFDALFEVGKEISQYASTIFINCTKK
ncbi:Trans-aconitate 2-methyltransferase protein [Marine Group I thaumarchaeote SCGC AAA799-B03]|uniref:Trans-aconitate 2-methyltransferase protein n=1 Tax=Marine Group I thaumarchaeote SCGC AAA799-B03 TaxID=1502289 RepID=A0A087S921_9ARCH|nr:Trans-aconitate 2-methyltransferase protein [Marine Group I thaumarchaeote SCGC AAA799-B03]